MTTAAASIPGRLGLPYLGETLEFQKNMFGFLEERQKRYGNVFKSRIVGRNVVFLAGVKGAEAFYDSQNISRTDAHPFPLVDLFGGINMEMYDGPTHLALKTIALSAFDDAAIGSYLPDMQQLIETALTRLSAHDEFFATVELRRLAIQAICWNVIGLSPGPATDDIMRDYDRVLNGLVSVPVPLPGTTYGRARAARDRLLAKIRSVIQERRRKPGVDALSRMLTAKASDGRVYSDDEALLEVHHMVIAGFIVYALMAELMLQLALQPELRERCAGEIGAYAPAGPLTIETLGNLPISTSVVMEAKRYVPLVPLAFGRAQRAFECEGYAVPENWTVYLALWLNNRDPAIFTNPRQFDPDRFSPQRAEDRRHPLAFIPQGAEPPTGHRCLGLDYSTYLTLAFLTVLVRDYDWTLPPQALETDWKKLPPEPRDGLRMTVRRRNET